MTYFSHKNQTFKKNSSAILMNIIQLQRGRKGSWNLSTDLKKFASASSTSLIQRVSFHGIFEALISLVEKRRLSL